VARYDARRISRASRERERERERAIARKEDAVCSRRLRTLSDCVPASVSGALVTGSSRCVFTDANVGPSNIAQTISHLEELRLDRETAQILRLESRRERLRVLCCVFSCIRFSKIKGGMKKRAAIIQNEYSHEYSERKPPFVR